MHAFLPILNPSSNRRHFITIIRSLQQSYTVERRLSHRSECRTQDVMLPTPNYFSLL